MALQLHPRARPLERHRASSSKRLLSVEYSPELQDHPCRRLSLPSLNFYLPLGVFFTALSSALRLNMGHTRLPVRAPSFPLRPNSRGCLAVVSSRPTGHFLPAHRSPHGAPAHDQQLSPLSGLSNGPETTSPPRDDLISLHPGGCRDALCKHIALGERWLNTPDFSAPSDAYVLAVSTYAGFQPRWVPPLSFLTTSTAYSTTSLPTFFSR